MYSFVEKNVLRVITIPRLCFHVFTPSSRVSSNTSPSAPTCSIMATCLSTEAPLCAESMWYFRAATLGTTQTYINHSINWYWLRLFRWIEIHISSLSESTPVGSPPFLRARGGAIAITKVCNNGLRVKGTVQDFRVLEGRVREFRVHAVWRDESNIYCILPIIKSIRYFFT